MDPTDQILREQLLSQHNQRPSPPPQHLKTMPETSSPQSPNDPNDPAAAGSGVMSTSADSEGEGGNGDGRKGYGKRELSTSKRAAQNRAAQRAFRQRKEGYIKKLEEQVRDYSMLNDNFKAVQAENYQLRDYIINLQSRLLESQGEFPPPPSNVDGLHPGKPQHPSPVQSGKPVAPLPQGEMTAINQLRASAEQAASDAEIRDRRDVLYNTEPARSKRSRIGSHDMNAAQEALQGPTHESHRLGSREEVMASR